ncbi:MAG: choice-of-anchor X domain-containing protein [Acidobacteriota bacterium]
MFQKKIGSILMLLAFGLATSLLTFAQDTGGGHYPPVREGTGTCGSTCRSSPFDPPKCSDSAFIVDCSGLLDTGCTFRNSGPLIFTIKVGRVVGDVTKLKQNGMISPMATLQMPAFDVDSSAVVPGFNPERDRVTFNGHIVPTEFLIGQNDTWIMNQFVMPIEWVNFPTDPGPGGTVTPADNTIRIDIDTANSTEAWCTSIDWAALTFDVARPVVMVHGILSSGSTWDQADFSWVNKLLNSLGLPNSNLLNMGNLDSIGNNAGKVATQVAGSRARWGVDKVNLVCHSKGGLDSRQFVEGSNSVERLIQLGTPNAGSPLADFIQESSISALGILPTILINALAGPAGVQLTTPYMAGYNFTHGSNPQVRYLALAGDYDPDCFILNPFCHPLNRLLLLISGPGDTVVPITSVHALGYTENRIFHSSDNNEEATHTGLTHSLGVFNAVSDRVQAFGTNSLRASPLVLPPVARTMSVVGSIAQGQVNTSNLLIDQATPTTFSLAYPSGNLNLALIAPSGQRFDAGNIAGNPNVAFQEGAVLGGLMEVFSFTTPEVGQWTVEVSAPSVVEPSGMAAYAVAAWLENPAITFTGALMTSGIHAGQSLRLLGTLKNGAAALTGAIVTAKVALPDNSTATVTLHDDGAAGDATANDGIYTGDFTATSQAGTYRFSFAANRAAGAGAAAFNRAAFVLGTVSASASTFNSTFSDSGLDTDSDTFFNQLLVQVGINLTATANYRVVGVLKDSQGHTQTATAQATLAAGTRTVQLAFDGATIYNNGVNGPYQLATLRLAEENGIDILPIEERTNIYQTTNYNFNQFQHSALSLNGSNTAVGVDTNSNGKFDLLNVGVGVNLINAGFYQWSARLFDRNGIDLGFASGSGNLTVGANTLALSFPGMPIGQNGVDGPYFVRGLLVFGANTSLVATDVFQTSPLPASGFEGFVGGGGVDIAITKVAAPTPSVVTGANVTYTLTVTNNGPSAATNVVVTDNLPSSTGFVSCAATGGGVCGGSGNNRTVTFATLANGATATVTLVAQVNCTLADGVAIPNTTTVTSSVTDSNPSNDSATATVTASNPAPVITCPATVSVGTTGNSANVSYTLPTVTDNCPGTTTPVCTPASGSSFALGTTTVTCQTADSAGSTASCSFAVIVNKVGTPSLADPLLCTGPGNTVSVTFTLTNNAAVAQLVTANAALPAGLVAVPGTCTTNVGSCAAVNPALFSFMGTLAAGQTATVSYLTQVADGVVPGTQLCVTTTASFGGGPLLSVQACTTVNCPAVGPGSAYPARSEVSDQKAGSVLVYNVYTSASDPTRQNTRISITNTSPTLPIAVHLFFVDGSTCSVADANICLTPNQTSSFLASDLDPGSTGYIVAIASDPVTGCPVNFNFLIGDEYVKFSSGHAANLGAEAFAAIAGGLTPCDTNTVIATLNFDGISYNRVPRALALSNIPSRADNNDTLLIINRFGGNLGVGASTLINLFGILYNDSETPLSFGFGGSSSSPGTCQFRGSLSNTFPRVTPRFDQFIPAGRSGWGRIFSQADIGLLGAMINFNPDALTNGGAFSQGHNLHKLTLTSTVTLTIPIFPPSC